jgi:hypothetical protein
MADRSESRRGDFSWDEAYTDGWAPWDIGRPQPTFVQLADAGEISPPVVGQHDADRARYVASLAAALVPGGVLHLLCFSELTPGDDGPRRITQDEMRAAGPAAATWMAAGRPRPTGRCQPVGDL